MASPARLKSYSAMRLYFFVVSFLVDCQIVNAFSHLTQQSSVLNNKLPPHRFLEHKRQQSALPRGVGIGNNALQKLMSTTSDVSVSDSDGLSSNADAEKEKTPKSKKPRTYYDSVICGGGPAGLLTAIMLSQKYGPSHKIAICERRPGTPPSPDDDNIWQNDIDARFYLLGIGHRGQKALRKFGLFDDFVKASVAVNGRRDWQPGQTKVEDGKIIPAKKDVTSRVLARDKLVGVLYYHLVNKYIKENNANIDLLYGYEVEPIDFAVDSTDLVTLRVSNCGGGINEQDAATPATNDEEFLCNVDNIENAVTTVQTKLLVGSDGSARTIANAMELHDQERSNKYSMIQKITAPKPFKVTRYINDNPRVYKSVPIKLPADWPHDLNYSARSRSRPIGVGSPGTEEEGGKNKSKNESSITLEALPSDANGNLCALLLMKPEDDLAQPDVNPTDLRKFFEKEFPQFSALIDDDAMARVAKKPASTLPSFRYVGPRLHMGPRTVVLGDAAHTVKPYYGLGANTALEDVCILSDSLDEAKAETNAQRALGKEDDNEDDSKTIQNAVTLFSKKRADDSAALVQISRNMDRSGKLFFFCFILPLILDGMFHKVAPKIFSPNMFGMFQKQNMGFKQIQTKKRIDRLLQSACIATGLSAVGFGIKNIIKLVAKVTGKSQKFVFITSVLVSAVAGLVNKKLKSFNGQDPRGKLSD